GRLASVPARYLRGVVQWVGTALIFAIGVALRLAMHVIADTLLAIATGFRRTLNLLAGAVRALVRGAWFVLQTAGAPLGYLTLGCLLIGRLAWKSFCFAGLGCRLALRECSALLHRSARGISAGVQALAWVLTLAFR